MLRFEKKTTSDLVSLRLKPTCGTTVEKYRDKSIPLVAARYSNEVGGERSEVELMLMTKALFYA